MKRNLVLASVLALVLSLGTLVSIDGSETIPANDPGAIQCLTLADGPPDPDCVSTTIDARGFPFSAIEEYQGNVNDSIGEQTDVAIPAFVGNFLVWFAIALLGLLSLEWLAGLASKLVVRTVIGVAVAAYGFLVLLG